tara:strand:+ start:76 stop:267 length:192 start_codon:yes stop_codon:yes gene_type:complete
MISLTAGLLSPTAAMAGIPESQKSKWMLGGDYSMDTWRINTEDVEINESKMHFLPHIIMRRKS